MRYARYRSKARPGASEAVGAVVAIAITLVAGASAWSYVQRQASVSEGAIQNGAVNTNNYLNEHFGVIDMYFGTSTSATFWVYNTGSVTYQTFSVRISGGTGSAAINLLYNYTGSGGSKTDQVYDFLSTLATKCKTAATSYEAPSVTATTTKTTNAQAFTITVPPTLTNCPSFGNTFVSGTTYTIVVTGLYGNVVRYSQTA